MFLKQKLSKTAKNTIVKNYGRLKGEGAQAQGPPKYATGPIQKTTSTKRIQLVKIRQKGAALLRTGSYVQIRPLECL